MLAKDDDLTEPVGAPRETATHQRVSSVHEAMQIFLVIPAKIVLLAVALELDAITCCSIRFLVRVI